IARYLRKLNGQALQGRRINNEPLLVPRRRKHVGGRDDGFTSEPGQVRRTFLGITRGDVYPGANGGRTPVRCVKKLLSIAQQLDFSIQRSSKGVKLLTDSHGHRVLHLGTAHLYDLYKRIALGAK